MAITVLCIDDEEGITDLLAAVLKSAGYKPITTNSGERGIAMVREHNPDIVILDLMMPEINGWEVCEAIREFSKVPILILSALDSPVYVEKVLNAGADDFLSKPVGLSLFLATVNKFLPRKNGPTGGRARPPAQSSE
ncbi:MAG: response regulator [Chloroflexota bacterium]